MLGMSFRLWCASEEFPGGLGKFFLFLNSISDLINRLKVLDDGIVMVNILVMMKQVPDIEKVEFDREKGRIDRSSAEGESNPFDLNALEEALRFKEEVGGEVIVISMGPRQAEDTLKDALARGADRSILMSDKAFAAADTWATALTLSAGVKKVGGFDLILCGEKTVDGDTGQVGPEMAEILDIPHVTNVTAVTRRDECGLEVKTEIWGKSYSMGLEFPALVTVSKDVNEPRLPSLRDKLKAQKAEIEVWGLEDVSFMLDEEKVGLRGSKTSVTRIEVAPENEREGEVFEGDPSEIVSDLISRMEKEKILMEKNK